MLGVVPAQGLG